MKLTQLKEMAKRASPDQFYNFGKQMYGAEKVKALSWPEVKAIADKHDILIPAYLRSQKVGRGRFNIVPAEHADAKAKEEPKSAPLSKSVAPREQARAKDETPKNSAVADLTSALHAVYTNMRSEKEGRYADWREQPEEAYNGGLSIETRYWGHWETPQDVEDDGDYDWQVLSSDSRKVLREIIDKISKRYPEVKLTVDIGEKNWITIFAHPAKAVKEAKLSRGEQEAKGELDAFKDFMNGLDRYDLAMVVGRTDPEMGERGIAEAAARLKIKAPRIYAAMKKAFK